LYFGRDDMQILISAAGYALIAVYVVGLAICHLIRLVAYAVFVAVVMAVRLLGAALSLVDRALSWMLLAYLRTGDHFSLMLAKDPVHSGKHALRGLSRQSRRKWPKYYPA